MMNYIWGGLIIFSLLFALGKDFSEINSDRYRNGKALPVALSFPDGYDAKGKLQNVQVHISGEKMQSFYGLADKPADLDLAGTYSYTDGVGELHFGEGADLPEPLSIIKTGNNPDAEQMMGSVSAFKTQTDSTGVSATAAVTFPETRFVKLNAISKAALDFSKTAIEVALGLVGVLALWLGLMKIAEAAGMINALVRFVQPLLRPLFPSIPEGHPAMGMMILNMAANCLGLGNAATPFGIKAMEELQKLNPSDETATDDQVLFLVINTASVQLVPQAALVAVMGLAVNKLFFAITLATLLATVFGIFITKFLAKLPQYRKTNPQLNAPAPTS